jgi:hypothetical protein
MEESRLSYQQARAILAHTAAKHYSRVELVTRLHLVDPGVEVGDKRTSLSIAYMLAWRLLPASKESR